MLQVLCIIVKIKLGAYHYQMKQVHSNSNSNSNTVGPVPLLSAVFEAKIWYAQLM